MKAPAKERQRSATFEQVLDYIDGEPYAVILSRTLNAKIVAVAIESQEAEPQFYGAEISIDQWQRYVRGFVDLRFLFMFPRWRRWYTFSLAEIKGRIRLNSAENAEQEQRLYVPDAGFFSYDHSQEIVDLSFKKLSMQRYLTDGIWDLPDFTQFYGKLSDLYAFFLSLKKYGEQALPDAARTRIQQAFAEQPLRGGSSYINMYAGLSAIQDLGDKLSIGKIQYASPGEVKVRGRFDVFVDIEASFDAISKKYLEMKKLYDDLHDYLSKNNLLRRSPSHFDQQGAMSKYIYQQACKLASSMALDDAPLIYSLCQSNNLIFTKIILSHYRRVERYYMFFAEGRLSSPETTL